MMRYVRNTGILLVLIAAVLSMPQNVGAQILSRGDMFAPGAPPPLIGIELGLGAHRQQGTYQAACLCTFSDGSESGFLGGLLFELPLDYTWTVGLGMKFDFSGLNNSTLVSDVAALHVNPGGPKDSVVQGNLVLQRLGTVRELLLTFTPFIRYEFYRNGPFVQVGPGIGLVVSSSFTHTRNLLGPNVEINGIQYSGVTFSNGTLTETLENDSKIPNVNSLQLTALAALGYNINVGDNSVISPMVSYSLPITPVRPNILADNWKIQTIFFSVGLKMKLD